VIRYALVFLLVCVGCAVEAGSSDPGSMDGAAGSVAVAGQSQALTHEPAPGLYDFDNIVNLDFSGNMSSDCQTLAATLRPINWQRWSVVGQNNGCVGSATLRTHFDAAVVRSLVNCRDLNGRRLCTLMEGNSQIGNTNNSKGPNWSGTAHWGGTTVTVEYNPFRSNVL
jgi:hypothetical protein